MSIKAQIRAAAFMLAVAVLPVVGFAQQPWIPLGPDGGDVRSLAFDPRNPDRVFLGTSAGQLFLSSNSGMTWNRFARLGGGNDYVLDHIFIDPANSELMYVAGWSIEDNSRGDIFRSRDGGKTWQPLAAMHGKSVRAMAVAASDTRIIVSGALDGVFRSRDGGETWQRISPPHHAEIKNIESIAIDPRNPEVIYAGTWHLAWKTGDGGKTWHSIKNGVVDDSDVFSIIVDHANTNTVYLSACSGIYKSENAAELFRKIQGIPFSARRTRVLHQDPSNTAVVYAGTTEGLWRTSDAGRTWARITAANIIVNDVLVDPRHPERVLLATDRSGVLASNDSGRSFAASNRGFAHRQVAAVVADASDANIIYAGLINDKEFGGVFVSRNGGADWRQMSAGLAGRDVFALRQAANRALIAGTNGGIFILGPGSTEWRKSNTVVRERQIPAKAAKGKKTPPPHVESLRSELQARVVQLELNSARWFAATSAGLFESRDEGRTWRGGPVLGHHNFVAVRSAAETVLAATPNAVLLSRDGGASWSAAQLPPYVTAVYGVAIGSQNRLWIATREGAFRSLDLGGTWEHVLGGLPARHVLNISYDSEGGRLLAVSATGDLFSSNNAGESWQRAESGFSVRSVTVARGRLIAATAFDGVIAQPTAERAHRADALPLVPAAATN